jgi:hypothetical protein
MNSRLPYITLACALIAGVALTIAWRQHLELIEARARLMGLDGTDELAQRLRDAERRNQLLENRIAALQAKAADETVPATQSTTASDDAHRGRSAQRSPLDNPQVQLMRSRQLKASLDARYGTLFKQWNLSPEQLDKVKNLLAERQATLIDVMMSAREQGISPYENPAAVRALLAEAQKGVDSNLRSALGDAAYTEFQAFEETAPQRRVVSQLEQELSYSETPLTPAQSDQLMKILAANTPPDYVALPVGPGAGGGPGMGMGLGLGGGPGSGGGGSVATAAPITATAISQAQPLLSEKQLSALVELQQQQQGQQQLRRAVEYGKSLPANAPGTPGQRPGS